MAARFVRLAGQSEDAEHLRAPVVLKVPGGVKLGYAPHVGEANQDAVARDEVLVSGPPGRSLLRPLLEGALGVVLITLLLGSLSDMTNNTTASGSNSAGSSGVSPIVGAVLSALLVLVGFQGVRASAPGLLRAYALGAVLLLLVGLLFNLPGIVSHGQLHAVGVILAVSVVRLSSPQRYLVDAA